MKEQKQQPPRWLDKLVEKFCAPHLLEEVLGDLHERYYLEVQKSGEARARKQYWKEVLSYMRAVIFKREPSKHPGPGFADMLRNNFKIARRNIYRNKAYSSINVLGHWLRDLCHPGEIQE